MFSGNPLIIFCIIAAGVSCGYFLRRAKLLDIRAARMISLIVFVTTYPAVAFLSIWPTPLETRFALLPCIQGLSAIIMIVVVLAVSRLHRLSRMDRGAFILACALSNQGYTMGGLVCYLFYGSQGLALAQIYCFLWGPLVVLVIFPLANHFNPDSAQESPGRIIWNGVWHIRSLGIIGLLAGIIFSLLNVPYPSWVGTYRLVGIIILLGTFTIYGIIGLNLHLSDIRGYTGLCFSQAGVKFVIAPLLAVLMITLFGLKSHELPAKVALTMAFMPTAVNSVLISNIFGLNGRLASALFVVNTVLFLGVVLPLLYWLYF